MLGYISPVFNSSDGVTPPKSNIDTTNDGFQNVSPFTSGYFFVSMLVISPVKMTEKGSLLKTTSISWNPYPVVFFRKAHLERETSPSIPKFLYQKSRRVLAFSSTRWITYLLSCPERRENNGRINGVVEKAGPEIQVEEHILHVC